MTNYPKRTVFKLTYDAECLYNDWEEHGGCSCHTGCAPYSSCCHEGNPISLEENDEAWEIDEEVKDMSRSEIVDKGGSRMQPPHPVWVAVKDLETLKVDCEVQVNGVETRITKLDHGVGGKVIGFYTSRDIFSNSNPKNFWGRNSHAGCGVWVRVVNRPKSEWFGYKYRVTPESSKLLQEAVFADGGSWLSGVDKIQFLTEKLLQVSEDGKIGLPPYSKDLPEKEPPQIKLPKVETKALQEEKVSVQSHLHEGNKTFTITGYDLSVGYALSVGKDLSVNMTKTACVNNFNQQEDVNMTNVTRRVVNVKFFDEDAGLDVADSLVAFYDNVVTQDSDESTVRELLMNLDVAAKIEAHNKVRAKTVDLEILRNTGNEVTLRPIKLKDLRIEVTKA